MTETVQSVQAQMQSQVQTQAVARMQEFSRIKEVVSGWSGVRQYLRGGDEGQIVPFVIPKDRRRYGWLFLLGVALSILAVLVAVMAGRHRRDRAGDYGCALALREDRRHPLTGEALPLASVG